MKTKQVKLPTEKAAKLCLPDSTKSVFSIQLSDFQGYIQFHSVFIYYTGRLPNVLEFNDDFKTLEMYSFLTKDNAERVIWEFSSENSKFPIYADKITKSFGYAAILYDSGEMIVAFPNKISYFYIKEELFTKEELREISLDFLKKRKSRS